MRVGLGLAVSSLLIMTAVVSVQAQEVSDIEGRGVDRVFPRPPSERPGAWEATAETAWSRRSGIHEVAGKVTMGEVKAGLARKLALTPRLQLSTGLNYTLRLIDAPEAANLPESLHAVAVTLAGEYRKSDDVSLGLRVAPGLNSDFKALSTADVRVPVMGYVRYHPSRQLSLMGGVAYSGNRSFPVLPAIGALYLASERWAYTLGFPRTGVVYKPDRKTDLTLGAEFSGGEYHLHDPAVRASIISYREVRLGAGADLSFTPNLKLGISAGYGVARRFVFYEGSRSDLHLSPAPFGRAAVRYLW